jgi:hypothetical protein
VPLEDRWQNVRQFFVADASAPFPPHAFSLMPILYSLTIQMLYGFLNPHIKSPIKILTRLFGALYKKDHFDRKCSGKKLSSY